MLIMSIVVVIAAIWLGMKIGEWRFSRDFGRRETRNLRRGVTSFRKGR